jgi:hypothetical protein
MIVTLAICSPPGHHLVPTRTHVTVKPKLAPRPKVGGSTPSVARSSLLPPQFPGNVRGRPVFPGRRPGNSHAPSDHAVRKRRKPRHAGPAHMHTPHATAQTDGSDRIHVGRTGRHRCSGAGRAARSHSTPVHSGGGVTGSSHSSSTSHQHRTAPRRSTVTPHDRLTPSTVPHAPSRWSSRRQLCLPLLLITPSPPQKSQTPARSNSFSVYTPQEKIRAYGRSEREIRAPFLTIVSFYAQIHCPAREDPHHYLPKTARRRGVPVN